MNEDMRQSLSALMDGEADELEIRRVLKRLETDQELRGVWRRFHIGQSVMHRQFDGLDAETLGLDITARVSQALSEEQAYTDGEGSPRAASPSAGKAWKQQLGGFAIAASVALFTVFGVRLYDSMTGVEGLQTPELAQSANLLRLPTANVAAGAAGSVRNYPVNPSQNVFLAGQRLPSADSVLVSNVQQAQRNRVDVQRRLEAYLMQHAENAALNSSQGMMPLARVSKFEVSEF